MTYTPARRHRRTRGPLAAVRKARRTIRQPVWRWSFLTTAVSGWVLLGDGSSFLPGTGFVLWLVTGLALYAWWPILRRGHGHRRRSGRLRRMVRRR